VPLQAPVAAVRPLSAKSHSSARALLVSVRVTSCDVPVRSYHCSVWVATVPVGAVWDRRPTKASDAVPSAPTDTGGVTTLLAALLTVLLAASVGWVMPPRKAPKSTLTVWPEVVPSATTTSNALKPAALLPLRATRAPLASKVRVPLVSPLALPVQTPSAAMPLME
jgi:hypothetical protein